MNWKILLDMSAAALLLGLFLAGAYEMIAAISASMSHVSDIPLISSIVVPWVKQNRALSTLIAVLWLAATAFFLAHFYFGIFD